MTALKEKVTALNELIISGHTLKAMQDFYSANIEMQENEDIPLIGKTVCMEHEKDNLQKINTVESILLNQAVDEEKNVVFSEWQYLVTYKNNRKILLTEVSVQHWKDGQIVKEKFYYKSFQKVD